MRRSPREELQRLSQRVRLLQRNPLALVLEEVEGEAAAAEESSRTLRVLKRLHRWFPPLFQQQLQRQLRSSPLQSLPLRLSCLRLNLALRSLRGGEATQRLLT